MAHVDASSLYVYDTSYGGLLNFDRDIVSASVLTDGGTIGVSVSGRAVLLLFSRADVSDVPYLDILITFADGTEGLCHCVLLYSGALGVYYDASASGDSGTINFPVSSRFNAGSNFSLTLVRSIYAANWYQSFRCSFVTESGSIDLVPTLVDQLTATFNFDSMPHGLGRIELIFNESLLRWSFECSFV